MRQARTLDSYLDSTDGLAPLRAHAERLIRLQRIYRSIAPSQLAASSRIANYKLGKIVIHADNGAIAAKLRQLVPSLCDELSKRGCEVTEMQVKTQPPAIGNGQRKDPEPRFLGVSAKKQLAVLAQNLPELSPLGDALRRLIARCD